MSKFSILVIDDEPEICQTVSDIFEGEFAISMAFNVTSALTMCEASFPDIIITDISMPGEDGFSLLKKLKAIQRDVIVVFITGYGDKKTALRAIRYGAFDYIEKPFTFEVFQETLQRAKRQLELHHKNLDELVATDRLAEIGNLTTDIIHEIFNPLTVISGNASVIKRLMLEEKTNKKKVLESCESIMTMCGRISQTANSVKKMAYQDSTEKNKCALSEIIEDAIEISKLRFNNANIAFSMSDTCSEISMYCNKLELSQALINLFNNSIYVLKDFKGKKMIEVSAFENVNGITLRIADTGPGISKNVAERLFRGTYTTKPIGEGTGRGLSIVQRIVWRHGGSILLEKASSGAAFILRFPSTAS